MDPWKERERARGDRTPGKALWQLAHRIPREDNAYDLILNGEQPPTVCAEEILWAIYGRTGSAPLK